MHRVYQMGSRKLLKTAHSTRWALVGCANLCKQVESGGTRAVEMAGWVEKNLFASDSTLPAPQSAHQSKRGRKGRTPGEALKTQASPDVVQIAEFLVLQTPVSECLYHGTLLPTAPVPGQQGSVVVKRLFR